MQNVAFALFAKEDSQYHAIGGAREGIKSVKKKLTCFLKSERARLFSASQEASHVFGATGDPPRAAAATIPAFKSVPLLARVRRYSCGRLVYDAYIECCKLRTLKLFYFYTYIKYDSCMQNKQGVK